MKNGITRWLLAAVVLGVMSAATPASADNTICANAQFVNMGQTISDLFTNAITNRWYQVHLRAGHSYAFMTWAPDTDVSVEAASINMSATLDNCTTAVVFNGSFSDQETSIHNGDGNTFIPATTGDYRIHLAANSVPTNSYLVVLQAVETTLYSPFWQVVPAASYDAAPQISNGDETARSAVVTFFSTTGTVLCTTTRAISGNGMSTFGVSSLGGSCAAASFGSARIAHNGPPGTMTGNITTFSGASGLSFDSPFFPLQTYSAASNLR